MSTHNAKLTRSRVRAVPGSRHAAAVRVSCSCRAEAVYRFEFKRPSGRVDSFEFDGKLPSGRDPGTCPALVATARASLAAAFGKPCSLESALRAMRGEGLDWR